MDRESTIEDLRIQLEVDEAELQRLRAELARAKDELARELVERRQTEEALQESEEQFQLIVEHSYDVVYTVRPDGIATYIGPNVSLYGYAPEEIMGKHFLEFVAPEQRQRVIESFETGTKAGTNYPTVFHWLKKDGSRVWVEVIGNAMFDDLGEPVRQVGVIRNINERKLQEERMQSLELLLESLDAECFVKDRDGIYQYINRSYERQFGVSRADVIGKDDVYVFGEENAAVLRENDERIMASRKTEAVEESGYLEGRGFLVYHSVKTPIIDEAGNVTGICGVGIDITHLKSIEVDLRKSRAEYRDLVERISEVIYAIDTLGQLTYVSPAIESLMGYSPAEVVGRPFSEFIVPEDLLRAQENFRSLGAGAFLGPNEYRFATKEGEVRWMRVSSQPIWDREQTIGVRGTLIDVTDRVQAESRREAALEALRESEERWRSVTETSPDRILLLDANLNVQFANSASPGLTVEELIGRPLHSYVEKQRQAEVKAILEGVLETGEDASYETIYRCPDGTVINYEASVTPRRMPGTDQIVGLTISTRDITGRKRAVAAAERERLAGDLHDSVTQTLFSIAAIAEVLPDIWEQDPDKARRGLGDLQQQTKSALAEMRSLLLAWRPRGQPERSLGDLLCEMGEEMAARTQMPVTTTIMGECHPPAEVNDAFYHIAQEGLNNVVKHADASRAIIRLQRTDEGLSLSIRDDGSGFDPERISPYHLGLGIMRERALAVGVDLRISSKAGKGTEIVAVWEDPQRVTDE